MRTGWLLTLLAAPSALGWPADWHHEVAPDSERFVQLGRVDWLEVDAPATLEVEWIGQNHELMLGGRKPGRAHLLLGAEGKVALWRVRVATPPQRAPLAVAAARRACPSFTQPDGGELRLEVTVESNACRAALATLFQSDEFEGRQVQVTFTQEQLQAQLAELTAAAAAARLPIQLRYHGAGLVLEGELTRAQHRAALWLLVRSVVGKLVLDDQTRLKPEADAGAAPADAGPSRAGRVTSPEAARP